MAMRSRTFLMLQGLLLLTVGLTLVHCAHDIHEKRADTIKDHVEAFYDHLKHDRVAAAVRENEAIEHLSAQLGNIITQRVNQPGTNQVDREWTDLRTANETAAQNWLALGQYLSIRNSIRKPGQPISESWIPTPARQNAPIEIRRREPSVTWTFSIPPLPLSRDSTQVVSNDDGNKISTPDHDAWRQPRRSRVRP